MPHRDTRKNTSERIASPVFQGFRLITFSFSNPSITTLTRPLIAFIGELPSKVFVVPVHTSSPLGFAVE
jgi:hypothetical protein